MRKNILLFLFILSFTAPIYTQNAKGIHRWSTYTGLLVQNGPFREFALPQPEGLYAKVFDVWQTGNAAMGITFGAAYDYTFSNRFKLRLQTQLESAGWISGVIDLGFGVRLPFPKGVFLSFETYFSISQTGGELKPVQPTTLEGVQNAYVALFGFKGRFAVEIALNKKYFIAPFIAYTAYPWIASNIKNLHINGFNNGALIDSLLIGIEFGSKF